MTIIITGGAGFIGSNFIDYQLKNYPNNKIVCIDKLTYAGNLKNLDIARRNPKFSFYKADICDKTTIDRIFIKEQPNIVVNFAAETHVDRSINNPSLFMNTNIMGTQVLLDACLKYNISRFHQISTDEVYGDLPIESTLKFSEEMILKPSSPYSASKASADLLTLAYHKTYGLNTSITRCSNNYGAYQFPEKLIPLVIKNAMNHTPVPVYGNGKNVRDWINVQDHCKAIDLVIKNGSSGSIYNVGGNSEKSNIDIVSRILEIMEKPKSLIHFVSDRLGHDRRYAVDYSKINHELNWRPDTSFDDGLAETIKWYINHQEWMNRII